MVVVNANITPENAREYGYNWVSDLFPAILKGEIRSVEDFRGKEFWIMVKAKMKNNVLGLYKPINEKQIMEVKNKLCVSKNLIKFPVDHTLNPESATGRGYRWVEDFIYDKTQDMERSLYSLIKSLIEDGYKIGKAKEPMGYLDRGWYAPLKKDNG